ncbi:hypothetical protein TNCV_4846331 [Trichonephila clavipes]|uniref:Uncharacterized protein n=1 Tax=Trichonephila clavipes TaxID=2585209 RepID=A0A8X6WLK4_TRICX|nr:hypothetical protein TNCV_4846331 [Trichonephila clavipes]
MERRWNETADTPSTQVHHGGTYTGNESMKYRQAGVFFLKIAVKKSLLVNQFINSPSEKKSGVTSNNLRVNSTSVSLQGVREESVVPFEE